MNKCKSIAVSLMVMTILVFSGCKGMSDTKDERAQKTEKAVIKIGAILPLTGPLAPIGVPEGNVLDLAIQQLNAIQDKYSYTLIPEDSKGKTADGVNAANKLINIDRVDLLFVSLTNVTKAVLPITKDKNIPVFANSMANDLTSLAPNVFRFFPSTINETKVWIDEIRAKGYKKPGYLFINAEYALEEKQILKDSLEKMSLTLVAESFELGGTDFRTQLLKFKSEEIDVLIISGLGLGYTVIINQMKDNHLAVPVVGDIDFGLALAKNEALKSSEGLSIYNGVVFSMININTVSQEHIQLLKDYKSKYSIDLLEESEAIFFYDALNLTHQMAIRLESYNPDSLIKSLSNVEKVTGLSGEFSIIDRSANIPLIRAVFKDGHIVPEKLF